MLCTMLKFKSVLSLRNIYNYNQGVKVSYVIYKNLFISESEMLDIKSQAITDITRDGRVTVSSAYTAATVQWLDQQGLLNLSNLSPDSANRKAEVAEYFRKFKL